MTIETFDELGNEGIAFILPDKVHMHRKIPQPKDMRKRRRYGPQRWRG
jgi:hypothetical protein